MNIMHTSNRLDIMEDTLNLDAPEPTLPMTQQNLDRLIELYLTSREEFGIGRSAIKNYHNSLKWFAKWWETVGPANSYRLSTSTLKGYGPWLSELIGEKTGRPFTFNYRKASHFHIKQMFNWACERGITRMNWAFAVPTAKGHTPKRVAPTMDTLLKLFRAMEEGTAPLRDMAILAVFCGTGIRLKECADLMADDVKFNQGESTGRITIHKGKGGKFREVVFDESTGYYLKRYMEICNRRSGFYLWYSTRLSAKRLTYHGIDKVIRAAKERAGLTTEIQAAHDLRRFFATHWNRTRPGMGNTRLLQEQLGHANMRETMEIYTLPNVDDIQRQHVSPMTTVHQITQYQITE